MCKRSTKSDAIRRISGETGVWPAAKLQAVRSIQHRAALGRSYLLYRSCQMPNQQIQSNTSILRAKGIGRDGDASKAPNQCLRRQHHHTGTPCTRPPCVLYCWCGVCCALLLVWCALRCNRVPLLLLVLHQEKPFLPDAAETVREYGTPCTGQGRRCCINGGMDDYTLYCINGGMDGAVTAISLAEEKKPW